MEGGRQSERLGALQPEIMCRRRLGNLEAAMKCFESALEARCSLQ